METIPYSFTKTSRISRSKHKNQFARGKLANRRVCTLK